DARHSHVDVSRRTAAHAPRVPGALPERRPRARARDRHRRRDLDSGREAGMTAIDLDGVTMLVSTTDDVGVVDAGTRVAFRQRGDRVLARYGGGRIARGVLVGGGDGAVLTFRYLQVEDSGEIHGGRSTCDVGTTP